MNITPLHLDLAGNVVATFDLYSAVQRAGYGVPQPLKKLRALATLLDISIPKGLHTFRPKSDPDEYRLYDADDNELWHGRDLGSSKNRTPAQIKAEYIADRIRKQVDFLNNPEAIYRAHRAR